ncbi:MAG: pre-peptidase C-terminal domain-containing protein [Planctomycetaceae bacterium]|nr:pre-peptidase C-terminal domain-containing protein [Planctomycetaceae bacterium]
MTRNLWHVSSRHAGDTGSGESTPFDFSRDLGDDFNDDGTALFFGNELSGSTAGNKNNRGMNTAAADINNLDFPNGAQGSVISNAFDLSPYTSDDKPFLEFNYYLQTENTDAAWAADTPADNNPMRDSFRVFVGGDDGVWNLVATNNSLQPPQTAPRIDEFDYGPIDPNDPLSIQEPITDGTGVFSNFPLGQDYPDVVELYDDPNFAPGSAKAWRAARIDLSSYAGRDNLRLRFDFSTAGGMDFADGDFHTIGVSSNDVLNGDRNEEIRTLPASMLTDGERFEFDGDGNFTDIDAFNAGNTSVTVLGEHFEFDLGYVFMAPSGSSIADGDTFTIDGTVFEFEKDFPAVATNAVVVTDQFTTGQVATAIANAVNSAGLTGITAIVVGNRVNIVGATNIPTSGSGVLNATGTPALIVDGAPGVRTGHQAVPITLDMDRSDVALAVKTAMSEVFSAPIIVGTGSFRSGYINETANPNNTLATAFDVDLAPWSTNADVNVANGIGLDATPHISIIGRGDLNDGGFSDLADFYSFTANAGDTITLDIDNTSSGIDSFLQLLDGSGAFLAGNDDTFPNDAGSSTSLDSFLQFTATVTGTYVVRVSNLSGAIPQGATYELHITVTGHTQLQARPEVSETEPNDTLLTAESLDGQIWGATSDTTINNQFDTDVSTTAPHLTVVGTNVGSSDFYSFTVTDGETINLDLDSLTSSGFFILNVYNDDGLQIAGYDGTNFFGGITFVNDTGSPNNVDPVITMVVASSNGVGSTDTFTVEVTGWPPSPASTGYRLHVSVPSQTDNSALLAQIPEAAGTTTIPNIDPSNIKGWDEQGYIEVIGHTVSNNGPLGWSNTLPGDEFGAFGVSATSVGGWNRSAGALRGVNNRIEGVWVDDIVIGLVERGEIVVDAPVNDSFSIDTRIYANRFFANGDVDRDHPNYLNAPDSLEQLTGRYTLEIRQASDYALADENYNIKTHLYRSFDPNDRLTQALTLYVPSVADVRDGMTFTLSDGIDEVVFEFEDINVGNGIASSSDVAVPIDPVLDGFNVDSADVIARTIESIINSSTVQAILDISATAINDRVEIFGEIRQVVPIQPELGVTGRIAANVETTYQLAPLGPFDTFQFENTSSTENITQIALTLPEGQFFDLLDTFDPTPGSIVLFIGADPVVSPLSDSVGATFWSDPAMTIPLQDGDTTAYIGFTDFEPGERLLFNIGVSHYIDVDSLSLLTPSLSTADSGSRHLVDSTVTVTFDSNSSGAPDLLDRYVTARFFESDFFDYDNGRSEAVLGVNGLEADVFDLKGDSNIVRQQGQIIIESNIISDSLTYGIFSGPGVDNLNNSDLGNYSPLAGILPSPGSPRMTVEFNDDGLVPGIVIQNNLLIRNEQGGIDFAGDATISNNGYGATPFGRIVNNTILGGTTQSGTGSSVTFDGITFPTGLASFADAVVQYTPGSPHPFNNPNLALGAPDDPGNPIPGPVVGLGDGGTLIVQFVDNVLIASGDANADLHIFEAGALIEQMDVAISEDGLVWIDVGRIAGQPSSIDIDAATGINPAGLYRFVRITDVATDQPGGVAPGAEIDAIGAISSIPLVGSGVGIRVRDNASPTVLNNALARLNTAINIDAGSQAAGTILGANTYVDNVNDLAGVTAYGSFDASDKQAGNPDWSINDVFVDVTVDNLYPAPGSPLIDSSLDSLPDRSEMITLRDPLGLAQSPVSSPDLDIYGQTRADDDSPGTGPGAPGANVRKDRGAVDRVDFDDPQATVLVIDSRLEGAVEVLDEQVRLDTTGAVIIGESDTAVGEFNRLAVGAAQAVRQFILRFSDVGIGIDDAPILAAVNDPTGNTPLPFTLLQDGQPLVEGTDYIFVWNSNTDEAIFTHLTQFPLERNYTIIVDNDPAFGARVDLPSSTPDPVPNDGIVGIRDLAGNFVEINQADGTTQFTILLTDGVNDPPINGIAQREFTINEDAALVLNGANAITVSDADVHLANPAVLRVTVGATNGLLSLGTTQNVTFPTGSTGVNEASIILEGTVANLNAALAGLTFQPDPEYFNLLPGEATATNPDPAIITITTDDGGRFAGPPNNIPMQDIDTITVHVLAVNDPPTFNPIMNPPAVDEDHGPVSISGYATGMDPGPLESAQTTDFVVTTLVTSGNLAFTSQPAIDPSGTLTYEAAPDTNGTATLTVVLRDLNPGDPNHVSAFSTPQVVTLTVNAVNDEPVFALDPAVVGNVVTPIISGNEDQDPVSPLQLVLTSDAGPATATDELSGQTATFMVTQPVNTAGNLAFTQFSISPTGALTYATVPDSAGTATFTLWLQDDGSGVAPNDNATTPITVTIAVNAQPDPPLAASPDYTIDEGDPLVLDASGSTDPDLAFPGAPTEQLFYSWDLNNDGNFDIVNDTNAQITVPYSTLTTLGLTAPGSYTVSLRVTDSFAGTSDITTAALNILTVDYGDAPDTYGTLRTSTGAAHTIVPGFFLGTSIDKETNGQIPPGTDGADEDGIEIDPGIQASSTVDTGAYFNATASAAGKLDIWIDFNNNGTFEASEHLNGGTSYDLSAGLNSFNFTVPAGTVFAVDTWARARFSSTGSLPATGRAADGEVEDYKIHIAPLQDAVAVEQVQPMHSQTSDLTPILQWRPVAGSPPGANATYNIELRDSQGNVEGFEENFAGEMLEVSDPLPPGSYVAVITSFNRAGVQGPTTTLLPFEVVQMTVTAPTSSVPNGTPQISWTAVDVTDHYELEVRDALTGASVLVENSLPGTANSYSVTTELPLGSYQVRVRAVEDTTLNVGDWSPFQDFVVATSPVISAPTGVTSDTTPAITWSPVLGAVSYDVRIHNLTDDIDNVFTATGIGATTLVVSQNLPMAEYAVEVRGVTTLGVTGDWSSGGTFRVEIPGAVTAPSGRLQDSTPTFTWQAVPGADTYDLEIVNTSTSQVVLQRNGFGATRYTLPIADELPLGNYAVRIRANNRPAATSSGATVSAFSAASNFTVSVAPEILTPAVAIYDSTPQITWTLPLGATSSELEIFSVTAGAVALAKTNVTGTSYTLSSAEALAPGEYRIRIRSTNADLTTVSDWSTDHVFQLGSAPVLLGPSTGLGSAPYRRTENNQPTLTWRQSLAGEKSQIWISDVTNNKTLMVIDGLDTASYTLPSDLPIGKYRYWVRAESGVGEKSAWSSAYTFDVVTPPVVTPIYSTFDSTPVIRWTHPDAGDANVTWQVWLNRIDTSPNQIIHVQDGLTTTQYEIPDTLPNGRYKVWVRGFISGTNTAVGQTVTSWSVGEIFNEGGRPVVDAIGQTADTTPLITWKPVEGASSYQVYVALSATPGTPVINQQGVTTTSYQTTTALASGSYKVWVRAFSATGTASPWSNPESISLNLITTPVVNAIAASSDQTPLFSWSPVSNATRYEIFVSHVSASSTSLIRDNSITGTSYTSTTALPPGNYRVWVRAITGTNTIGPWSTAVAFTITAALDSQPAIVSEDLETVVVSLHAAPSAWRNDSVTVTDTSASVEQISGVQETETSVVATTDTVPADQVAFPALTIDGRATEEAPASPTTEADLVMVEWDSAIWQEESAIVRENESEPQASGGWLASLAMLTPSLLRRRGHEKKKRANRPSAD